MPAGWVAAAGAVGSAVEGVEANSTARDVADQNNNEAAKLDAAQNTMLTEAQQVAQTPYTPYAGSYAAPLSGNQQQAVDMASSTAGQGQNLIEKGVGQTDYAAGNTWNAQTAQKYMNPYTSSVVANSIENANQSYLQSLGQMKEQQAQEGAFGGSGTATTGAELASQNTLNVGNLTAQGYSNAYNEAINAWQADNARAEGAAQAYDQAGNDITSMNNTQINDLLATGGAAQAVAQTNLNGQYEEFLRGQGWQANQLNSLISAVKGAPSSPDMTVPPQSNIGNTILGLGSTLAGLYGGGLGGNGGNPGNLGGSTPTAAAGSNLTYDSYGNITGSTPYAPDTGYNAIEGAAG